MRIVRLPYHALVIPGGAQKKPLGPAHSRDRDSSMRIVCLPYHAFVTSERELRRRHLGWYRDVSISLRYLSFVFVVTRALL